MHTINLDSPEAWEWRESPLKALSSPDDVLAASSLQGKWTTCTQMPSQIQVEIINSKSYDLPHPFKGRNEEKWQWVGERDWVYRTSFDLPPDLPAKEVSELVLEGLDTFATVYLNGHKILESDNMFTPARVNVTEHLKPSNVLVIVFASAFLQGKRLEEQHLGRGKHSALWNGDPSRLFVRKAGYNYGWDWGPVLMTAGPWRPIRLETFSARIIDFHPIAKVTEDLAATLDFEIESTHKLAINITVCDPNGDVFRSVTGGEDQKLALSAGEFELWWSVGLGKQPLYTAKADLLDKDGNVVHSVSKRFGFRRLRVVQDPLTGEEGTSFFFEVNNVPVFAGGSNWIPIDSFITNATRQRYQDWLQLLVNGNQNMIRVWAGGYYEQDDFYEIADDLGILVWQDFAFGCGAYPAYPAFVESVRREAEANVRRLRSHPCIAIYAGNNEDYQVAEQMNLDYDPEDRDGDWSKTNFPAREIYERTLPKVVHALSDVYYHPGSPWGGKDTTDPTVGDIHQWSVWHGAQRRYQDWDQLGGRFVSEFGMQGLPDVRTVDDFLDGDSAERYPQSQTMAAHNKADGYERRQELYLIENIRHGFTMEDYVYASQLIQAEVLSTAYRLWRRNFKGPGKEYTAGALVWQLNDVYPCVSWAIVDYYLRPKPAYYAIKQSMAPLTVGVKRYTEKVYADPHSALFTETAHVDIWACSSTLVPKEALLVVEAFELMSGQRIYIKQEAVTVEPNRSTELAKLEVPKFKARPDTAVVVSAKLVDPYTQDVLSRFAVWPEPYKYLQFPSQKDVGLSVKVQDSTIVISAARPVKGLILSFSNDVSLSDNSLDLLPGDERTVSVLGLKEDTRVTWRYLGDSFVP